MTQQNADTRSVKAWPEGRLTIVSRQKGCSRPTSSYELTSQKSAHERRILRSELVGCVPGGQRRLNVLPVHLHILRGVRACLLMLSLQTWHKLRCCISTRYVQVTCKRGTNVVPVEAAESARGYYERKHLGYAGIGLLALACRGALGSQVEAGAPRSRPRCRAVGKRPYRWRHRPRCWRLRQAQEVLRAPCPACRIRELKSTRRAAAARMRNPWPTMCAHVNL